MGPGIPLLPEFEPRFRQPVTNRYTDYAIPTTYNDKYYLLLGRHTDIRI
jgi:hypothetical protein